MTGVLLGDDEVEVAGPGLVQRRLRLALRHRHAQARVVVGQPGQRLRQQREGGRLEDRDAHRAGRLVERRRQVGLGLLEPLEHRAGVLDEDLRLRRQLDAPARLAEQLDAHLALEERELLRDRGRTLVQRGSHAGQGAAHLDLAQEPESPDVEHAPPFGKQIRRLFVEKVRFTLTDRLRRLDGIAAPTRKAGHDPHR
jgi:hypothetical protein